MNDIVSFAQNREDIFLYVLLHKTQKGFYVDVGANHETHHSVTKFFYQRGWRGINIEPTKGLIKEYETARKRDVNLEVAISDKRGSLTFREYPHHDGLSTFDDLIKEHHAKSNLPYEDHEVKVMPLREVFKEHRVRGIDFLKIDVEGHETEVLRGNDWKKYRPAVVVLEGTRKDKCLPFLEQQNYNQVYFDGLNYYMAANERPDINMFQYPALILSEGYRTLAEKVLSDEHQALSLNYHNLVPEIERLQAKLEEIPSVRKAMRITARSLKRSLRARTLKITSQLFKPAKEEVSE